MLGAVEARSGGTVLALGPPQQRLVLAVLAAHAGQVASTELLIDCVWDRPPPGARRAMYVHIARIRRVFERAAGPDRPLVALARRSGGYVLDIDPQQVDVHRFRRLLVQARDPGHVTRRVDLLREAVGLWQGPPLSGLPGAWATRTRQAWRQEHLDAVLAWAEAELDAGRPAAVVPALTGLATEHPLTEPVAGMLMRALSAAGRTAEALDRYVKTRQVLVDELGLEPGPQLQTVHQAILRSEMPASAPQPHPPPVTDGSASPAPPAQLPLDPRGFAGRSDHLAHLDGLLVAAGDPPSSVLVVAVSGSAGVGKTALAVHWAHQVRDRFPDGQLYVDLHGFDPSRPGMAPAEAIRGFLYALRVPSEQIPTALAAQIGLYRSLLAGRRVLVVLDNARDSDQVRPLLPGAPGCLVLVTSRSQLASLAATEAAELVSLDPLTAAEAHQMLAARLGAARVSAELQATREIITWCARLPLALAVIAARAGTHPQFPLETFAQELRVAHGGLDAFSDADPATDVRAVLSCSYDTLSTAAARLFRLLGLHPGPDITVAAAASLLGITRSHTLPLLAEVTRAHLLTEHRPGRYLFHDLLRAYANELATRFDRHSERQAAMRRLVSHYLHTAHAGARQLEPNRDPITLARVEPGVLPEHLTDRQQALDWFSAEHRVLIAVTDAAATGAHQDTWRLAWSMVPFFESGGFRHDLAQTQRLALRAAQRTGDVRGQAVAHRNLARGHLRLEEYDEARAHLDGARARYEQLGDAIGGAHIRLLLGCVCGQRGQDRAALGHTQTALAVFRSTGNQPGLANALNNLAWYQAQLGDARAAVAAGQEALRILQHLRDVGGEAAAWDTLGRAYQHDGRYHAANECYERSLERYRAAGDQYGQAVVLNHLGDSQSAAGDLNEARSAWMLSAQILEQLAHPNAAQVHLKLRQLESGGAGRSSWWDGWLRRRRKTVERDPQTLDRDPQTLGGRVQPVEHEGRAQAG
jgi:DNA-binding SARP family transcriptional activator/tetratricopeptide (TPR) repeat protein